MEEGKVRRSNWGLIFALLVLAASILFTGIRISKTMEAEFDQLRGQVVQEIERAKEDLRREAISLIFAYRRAAREGRALTLKDLQEGSRFAQTALKAPR